MAKVLVNVPEFLHENRDLKLFHSIKSGKKRCDSRQLLRAHAPLVHQSKGVPTWSPFTISALPMPHPLLAGSRSSPRWRTSM